MGKIEYKILQAGHCIHPEFITIQGGGLLPCKFPAIFVLIKDPQLGNILFDTGYADHFFSSTKNWIYKLYALTTPVTLNKQESALEQLHKFNLEVNDIDYIILSHFHADHIAGIKDFPQAKFIVKKEAYEDIKNKKGFKALIKGFLPELLPEDFVSRLIFIEDSPIKKLDENLQPFQEAYDLFSTSNLLAINLPGHAKGQIGLYLPEENIFFIADAAWSLKAIQQYLLPNSIVRFIFDSFEDYTVTLKKLNSLYNNNKDIKIIASHCDSGLKKELNID